MNGGDVKQKVLYSHFVIKCKIILHYIHIHIMFDQFECLYYLLFIHSSSMHLAMWVHSEFPLSGSMHTAQLRQVREHLPILTHKALIAILSLMLFLLTLIINSLSFSSRWWCSSSSHFLVFQLEQSCFAKGDDGSPSERELNRG